MSTLFDTQINLTLSLIDQQFSRLLEKYPGTRIFGWPALVNVELTTDRDESLISFSREVLVAHHMLKSDLKHTSVRVDMVSQGLRTRRELWPLKSRKCICGLFPRHSTNMNEEQPTKQ